MFKMDDYLLLYFHNMNVIKPVYTNIINHVNEINLVCITILVVYEKFTCEAVVAIIVW
jgi:hypothetical protein